VITYEPFITIIQNGVQTGGEVSLWIFRGTEIVGLINITDRCPRIFVCWIHLTDIPLTFLYLGTASSASQLDVETMQLLDIACDEIPSQFGQSSSNAPNNNLLSKKLPEIPTDMIIVN